MSEKHIEDIEMRAGNIKTGFGNPLGNGYHYDQAFELGSERAARGEYRKAYFVPSNIKYSKWLVEH